MVCWLQRQVEPGDFGSILSLFWEQDAGEGHEPCPFTGVPATPCQQEEVAYSRSEEDQELAFMKHLQNARPFTDWLA